MTQRSLGDYEQLLLFAVLRLGEDAYGVTIRQEITRRTGRDIAIGAVYATLSRLEEKGLVRYTLSDPLPVQGGRTRKHFTLTAAGERALAHATGMLARMQRGWRPQQS